MKIQKDKIKHFLFSFSLIILIYLVLDFIHMAGAYVNLGLATFATFCIMIFKEVYDIFIKQSNTYLESGKDFAADVLGMVTAIVVILVVLIFH